MLVVLSDLSAGSCERSFPAVRACLRSVPGSPLAILGCCLYGASLRACLGFLSFLPLGWPSSRPGTQFDCSILGC